MCFLSVLPATSYAAVKSGHPAEEYRVLGYEAQQEGAFEKALTFYAKAAAMGSPDAWLHTNAGVIYEQLNAPDRAETEYLRALMLDPEYLPAYMNLAFLYKDRGDIPRAIRYFRERIRRAPAQDPWIGVAARELSEIDPAYRQAVIDEQMDETRRQHQQMEKDALSLSVARADGLYRQAGKLTEEARFDEAVDYIDKALRLTPGSPKLSAARSEILTKKKIFQVKERIDRSLELLESGKTDSAWQEIQRLFPELPGESDQP